MIRKLILTFTFILPSLAFAADLEGYYITAKGGVSKSMDTGVTSFTNHLSITQFLSDEDLGTGTAFGLSAGKYLSDNLRIELEVIKGDNYEYDAQWLSASILSEKADIESTSLFINGFYDFEPFSISEKAITPYLGGGVGISRNKMGTVVGHTRGEPSVATVDGKTISQFAYKLSAGALLSFTEQLSLDVNYQYVNLGEFKSGTALYNSGVFIDDFQRPFNGGEIKTQELMVGLQYKF
jgi:opacity protein-like surface antigen